MKYRLLCVVIGFLCACWLSPLTLGADDPRGTELFALVQAVSRNDTNTLKKLIAKGVDVNQRFGTLSETVLFRAASCGHPDVAQLLLAAGADASATNNWGITPFHFAAADGHRDVAEILLAQGVQFDARDAHGRTAILMAAKGSKDSEELALWLLEMGADPNVQANDGKETVMYNAALSGKSRLLKALVDRRARVDGKGGEGRSALHVAARNGDTNAVSLLIESGCAIDPIDDHGFTPLLFCINQTFRNQAAIIDLLTAAGADIRKTDGRGHTALDLAQKRVRQFEKEKQMSKEFRDAGIANAKAALARVQYHLEKGRTGSSEK